MLAEFRGKPLVCHALETIRHSPVDGAFVVVGDNSEAARELCEPYGFEVVENPEWEEGQATSVLAGLKALGDDFEAAVVMLADQPLVGAGAAENLIEAFGDGASIAVAATAGSREIRYCFHERCGRSSFMSFAGTKARGRSCVGVRI